MSRKSRNKLIKETIVIRKFDELSSDDDEDIAAFPIQGNEDDEEGEIDDEDEPSDDDEIDEEDEFDDEDWDENDEEIADGGNETESES